MYCLKCRRITETDDITTATSKNGRLMKRGQCIKCGKTKAQFIKRDAIGGGFLNSLVTNSHSKCICLDITLLNWEQNCIKD